MFALLPTTQTTFAHIVSIKQLPHCLNRYLECISALGTHNNI
jgi:hypothetical protein